MGFDDLQYLRLRPAIHQPNFRIGSPHATRASRAHHVHGWDSGQHQRSHRTRHCLLYKPVSDAGVALHAGYR